MSALLPLGRSGTARLTRALERWWSRVLPGLEGLANRTVLARVGPSVWVTYGALMAAGAAVMALWLAGLVGRSGMPTGELNILLAGMAVASLVGARLVWLGYQLPELLREPVRTLRTVGYVSWGGLLGFVGFACLFAALTGTEPLWLLDRTLLAAVALMILGRVGCLTYGCCYGRPWRRGIRWSSREAKVCRESGESGRVPRVPTQLLEALGAATLLLPAVALTATEAPSGTVAAVVVLLYGVLRFGTDFLRDERRFTTLELTAGQIASSLTVAGAWAALFLLDGPPGWAAPATAASAGDLLRGLPGVAAATAIVFVGCGFHWRRVGRW